MPGPHTRLLPLVALGFCMTGCATLDPDPAAVQTPPICPPAVLPFQAGQQYLEGYRVFTGPDGDSAVEPYRIDVRDVVLPFNGRTISIFDLPTSARRGVQIVSGPPNMDLPLHAVPYKEMFILLGGSFTFRTHDFSAAMQPGSVLLFEDTDARQGHGGTIGPCGYISLSIAP